MKGAEKKVTDEIVVRIKKRRADGVSVTDLCREFGVSPQTVYRSLRKDLDAAPLSSFAVAK